MTVLDCLNSRLYFLLLLLLAKTNNVHLALKGVVHFVIYF